MSQPTDHRPDIDGLRAVAILPVLLFHAGLGFSGGYVGVDVFFVISGYLITGLILRELEAETFTLSRFWERRIRRILPPLLAVMAASLLLGWKLLLPEEFMELCGSIAAQAAMGANVFFMFQTGYFQDAADSKPLLHCWSLAVEEQFYVLLPLALMGFWKYRRNWILPGLWITLVCSFLSCVAGSYLEPNSNYYLLHSRAWEMLLGSVILFITPAREQQFAVRNGIGFAGLGAILFATIVYGSETRFPGVSALLPCLGTAALLWAGRPETSTPPDGRPQVRKPAIVRLLSNPLLRGIGLISYALYLWHWPLLVFARLAHYRELSMLERAGVLGLTGLLATASWFLLESPFRNRLVLPRKGGILAFGAASATVLLAVGLWGWQSDGYPGRFTPQTLLYYSGANEFPPGRNIEVEDVRNDNLFEEESDRSRPIHCLVWGDSHAITVYAAVSALAKSHGKRCVAATYPATAPLLGYTSTSQYSLQERSPAFNDQVLNYVRRHKVPHVVLVCFWGAHAIGPDTAPTQRPEMPEYFQKTVRDLQEAGSTVWILKQVPIFTVSVPHKLARLSILGWDADRIIGHFENQQLRAVAYGPDIESTRSLGARVLDPRPLLTNAQGALQVSWNGRSLYTDTNHLSVTGALHIRPLFAPIFSEGPQLSRHADW